MIIQVVQEIINKICSSQQVLSYMPFNKTSSSKPVIFIPFREGVKEKEEEEVRW